VVVGVAEFRLLFEASPDVLLVLAPDAPRFTMVAATDARLAATHTTREQIIGKGLFELFPDNPDDGTATGAANLRASLDRVLATRTADSMAVQKYDIRKPDGSFEVKYWSPKNLPVLSPSGEVLYILHRVEDITELVRSAEAGDELRDRTRTMEREVIARSRELAGANAALRDANAKLGELDAAKTAFFSNVSHEFRTPLTLMLGPLEDSLADHLDMLSMPQRARVTLAHDNALRLLKLVNALLDFSRLEAGRMRASFAPIDLAGFTAELAAMFHSAVDKAGLELVIDCPKLSGPIWVDRDLWEKVVPNLVSNALKFTYAGRIAVRVREDDARALLEVTDTGVGIPEEQLPKIFERFHRVPSAEGRTHEGTGIGLSLVRELVELHGGRVTTQSVVGQGTTFRIEIPKGTAHLPADSVAQTPARAGDDRSLRAHVAEATRWTAPRAPAPSAPAFEASAARARVLVCDDNAELRDYISALLSPLYDVSTAVDGLAGLEAIRANLPDIVISDVMMPRLDGISLVGELRADPSTASVPVILLSARAGEEAAVEGLHTGADDYLVKPFSARELLARVRTHVQLAQTRRVWIAELEAKNQELEAFAYSVSHDLRAPLRAIDGFSQALVEDLEGKLDPQAQNYLHRVRTAATRMSALIDDLLRLASVTRGELRRVPVNLSALAREIVTQLQERDPARVADVTIDDDLVVDGDPGLLRTALENLLGNAWKYSSRRDRTRIEVGVAEHEGGRVYFVRDNGVGFDPAHGGKLFRPFQRLHSDKEFEGTGIGLATVQRIITRHRGRVWAEGERDAGATVFFQL
jgi:signal transduction histidine kinase